MNGLSQIVDQTEAERLATGFVFTEGPLWHPDGFYYFVDVRKSVLYRMTPSHTPEIVRTETGEGNGTTFDLQGRLVICEGGNRRVTRWSSDGKSEILMDRWQGKRLNRPNDVVCKSDGSLYFTDPGYRVPFEQRELPHAGVYRTGPDGTWVFAPDGTKLGVIRTPEYPANIAFGGPDLKTLFLTANTSVYTLRMKVPGQPHPWYRITSR